MTVPAQPQEKAKDPLALGLGSLIGGVGFGGACLTAAQIVVSLNQERYEALGNVLLGGLLVTVGVAGMCGWYRSYQLDNIWQRGVIAVLAAFGGILAGFIAAPIDNFLGVIGMIVWLAITIVVGVAGTRWAISGRGV